MVSLSPNLSPRFTSVPVMEVTTGKTYRYDADAVDPDGDTGLVYSIVTGPVGAGKTSPASASTMASLSTLPAFSIAALSAISVL